MSEFENRQRLITARLADFYGKNNDENDEKDVDEKNTGKEDAGSAQEAMGAISRAAKGPKWKAPVEALKLAHSFREKVKNHDNSPYLVATVVAIFVDLADATIIIGWFCKPFLFYFLWGKGTFKVKITLRVILFFDCIPPISWLPLSTIAVIYAWKNSAIEAMRAKRELEKLNKEFNLK